jgi:hypothetical protein
MKWEYVHAPLESIPSEVSGLVKHEDGTWRLPHVSPVWLSQCPRLARKDGGAWFVVTKLDAYIGYGEAAHSTAELLFIDNDVVIGLSWDKNRGLEDPTWVWPRRIYGCRAETMRKRLQLKYVTTRQTGVTKHTLPRGVARRLAVAAREAWPSWPQSGTRCYERPSPYDVVLRYSVPHVRPTQVAKSTFSISKLIGDDREPEIIVHKGDLSGAKTWDEQISEHDHWLRAAAGPSIRPSLRLMARLLGP